MNSQIPLATLANTIKASIAAGDKAADKAEQHYKAAGLYLVEAKRLNAKTSETWPTFLISKCNIGSRRADELISIAEGRTSLEEVRDKNKQANAAYRERQSASRDAHSSETPRKIPTIKILNPRLKLIGSIDILMRDADLADLIDARQLFIDRRNQQTHNIAA
jgi:hypothetical protein